MDWQQEIIDSSLWLIKTLCLTALFFSLLMVILIKFTRWGSQFWQLSKDYFQPKQRLSPFGYFLIIVFFNLLSVRVHILVSNWYNAMYQSLQDMNETAFWQQMALFSVVATVSVSNVLLEYYFTKRFVIHWRIWLNEKMLNSWTEKQAYYKVQCLAQGVDNPDQRIQHDISAYVSNSLDLATGLISSVVSIFAFTLILWNLSGPMLILGVEVPHAMVFFVFIYVLISSIFAFKIGRPLIQLNFINERLNANYRYSLIRLKEYAESIAFYRGEKMENQLLFRQFSQVIDNIWQIIYRTLKLSGFNLVISQASVIFPFVLQAGRYFNQQITFGDLLQTTNAFSRVQSSLSFFRTSYDDFAAYRAVLDRLTGFENAISRSQQATGMTIQTNPTEVRLENLNIYRPDGQMLVQSLNLVLHSGSSLLIQGVSGAGKTILLRTIAGLWFYADGKITRPENCLFLSQKPYIPQGRLIDALYYPELAVENTDLQQAKHYLQQVQLGHLSDKLELDTDWTSVLSLGEQQRLAFARLLLHKPRVAFLDEATASMDEGLEDAMYRLLQQQLPEMILISVGHRSTLTAYHQQSLNISLQ